MACKAEQMSRWLALALPAGTSLGCTTSGVCFHNASVAGTAASSAAGLFEGVMQALAGHDQNIYLLRMVLPGGELEVMWRIGDSLGDGDAGIHSGVMFSE